MAQDFLRLGKTRPSQFKRARPWLMFLNISLTPNSGQVRLSCCCISSGSLSPKDVAAFLGGLALTRARFGVGNLRRIFAIVLCFSMETGRFWRIYMPFWGPQWSNCAVDQEKVGFSMETGRFWPICPFEARNGQIWSEFLPVCCRPKKKVFQWKVVVSGPSAFLVPEMVKFGPNLYYRMCAVHQEKAVFEWTQAVSGPSILLGPAMVQFDPNFCFCAVDQENAVFQWKRAVSGAYICPFGARNGQIVL